MPPVTTWAGKAGGEMAQDFLSHMAITSAMYSPGMDERNALMEFLLDALDLWDRAVETLSQRWQRLRTRLRKLISGQRPK